MFKNYKIRKKWSQNFNSPKLTYEFRTNLIKILLSMNGVLFRVFFQLFFKN